MAPTLTDAEPRVEPPRAAPADRIDRIRAAYASRPPTAFKLTDTRGRCAYVWWEEEAVVEADDAAFRRRVLSALKKPIWSTEDEVDEYGVPWSTKVLLQPDDPRYPSRLCFRWDQIGLGNLAAVEVVRRDDRLPVRTLLSLLAAASDG